MRRGRSVAISDVSTKWRSWNFITSLHALSKCKIRIGSLTVIFLVFFFWYRPELSVNRYISAMIVAIGDLKTIRSYQFKCF